MDGAHQFTSDVADMKNSFKDKSNATPSCAGHFIEEHLVGDRWDWRKRSTSSGDETGEGGMWAHLDIAGRAWNGARGTGYGVALLVELAHSAQNFLKANKNFL